MSFIFRSQLEVCVILAQPSLAILCNMMSHRFNKLCLVYICQQYTDPFMKQLGNKIFRDGTVFENPHHNTGIISYIEPKTCCKRDAHLVSTDICISQ